MQEKTIAVIGLGYVGLPLAVEFGKRRKVIGFDINKSRVDDLNLGNDFTLEVSTEELKEANFLSFTENSNDLHNANIYIVTVPTPIDEYKKPDLSPLVKASEIIGKYLSEGDLVIYESTVYPGATEEVCVPILENISGKKFNNGFYVGYSPERINPGDKNHRLTNIKKITSGSTPETAQKVDDLYKEIIVAGTHCTSSIRVAEAAKVIENTQRDLNIALINELALIFNKMEIDTQEVLEASGTKWNFLPFQPGLVGGHCIGVDPYYLTFKCESLGYNPELILVGRRLNDSIGAYLAAQMIKEMATKEVFSTNCKVLLMGLSFKENCPDLRNTKVVDIKKELENFSVNVDVYDPWINKNEADLEYNIKPLEYPEYGKYDGIIIAVGHDEFKKMGISKIREFGCENVAIVDVKSIFERKDSNFRL
jgi:UDP-N-acetyl-D-glucosamine/UDP-N-acetyl-D-galactosamine dehydrogenase